MAPKKAKAKTKPGAVPEATAAANTAAKPAQTAPIKKKKKHDPLRPQPAWLFPPDEENPILNPKGKSKEELQKEIDERLAAIKFLEHKSVTAPVKTAPPSELLQLIGAFFASYGFVSTGRIFSLERNARKKLEGWNDQIGEKKFAKNQPDLVKIFKDWRADWEGESDAETSSSGEDSEDDVSMKDVDSDSDDSSDGSSEDEEKPATKSAPKSNGVKIRTQLREPTEKSIPKVNKTTSPSPSATSESESESEEEQITANTTTKIRAASASTSSSDSESASDTEIQSKAKQINDLLSHITQTSIPPPIVPQAASDSSETLKGNSPSKEPSPSISSSSSSASSSSSDSSEDSDSSSEIDTTKKQPSPKSNPEKKISNKRKATSPAAEPSYEDDTEEPTTQTRKKLKTTQESFSRIPKDIKIDPRLASNKYVSYDYADKAHRDLVVTKGKGFTKEKNKKKRGAYRGGRIDTEGGKAVKFDD